MIFFSPMNSRTVLFLHGPMVRVTRLFLAGLSSYAAKHGWNIQQVTLPPSANQSFLRKLIEFWHPLGIIETCGHDEHMPIFEKSPTVPYVLIDSELAWKEDDSLPTASLGFVNCDSRSCVEIAARALLKRNFASYAYVSAYRHYHWSETRRQIFKEMTELNGNPLQSFDGTGTDSSSAEKMIKLGTWLKALPKPCGLLTANDRTAAIVLASAAQSSVRIPEELCVIGIDDDESLCETLSPPLTSVKIDFRNGGHIAGETLRKLISKRTHSPIRTFYAASDLTKRLSTRQIIRPAPAVTKALEEIRRRATEGISSSDILPILGGSRRTAEKQFRTAVGKSILEEILDVRFEKLLSLLAAEHVRLDTMAGFTGFKSENHLQRMFKSRYGMSMSEYREKAHRH